MGKSESGLPTGVRPRGDAIEISFRWQGKRHYVTWPVAPTPQNIHAAARVRTSIASKSRLGVLTLDELNKTFPGAFSFEDAALGRTIFATAAQSWLDQVDVSVASRHEYKKALNCYWMPLLAHREIASVKYKDLRDMVNGIEWTSAKTRNNALIPLRGVFKLAFIDELIDSDPSARLANQKHQKPAIDPFSRDEAELIIADLYANAHITYAAFFELAFFTGMRTSEMLGLEWANIDLRKGFIRVKQAQSKGLLNETTKTYRIRDIILNERSRAALMAVKSANERVFNSPRTGLPWATEKAPRVAFTESLKRLDIRHRPAYNTRHTYATMMLMADMKLGFAAAQMGHSITMFTTTYAKWVNGDEDKKEMAKLDVATRNGGEMVA